MSAKRVRVAVRGSSSDQSTGERVVSFGVRVGYWPCLRGPFITLTLWWWHFDLWFGLASYKATPSPSPGPTGRSRDAK